MSFINKTHSPVRVKVNETSLLFNKVIKYMPLIFSDCSHDLNQLLFLKTK